MTTKTALYACQALCCLWVGAHMLMTEQGFEDQPDADSDRSVSLFLTLVVRFCKLRT